MLFLACQSVGKRNGYQASDCKAGKEHWCDVLNFILYLIRSYKTENTTIIHIILYRGLPPVKYCRPRLKEPSMWGEVKWRNQLRDNAKAELILLPLRCDIFVIIMSSEDYVV